MAAHKWRFIVRNKMLGEPPGHIAVAPDLGGIDNLRTIDYERPLHHGEDSGAPDLMGGRDINIGLRLIAENDPATVRAMWSQVAAAFAPSADTIPLLIKAPEGDRLSYGKPRRCVPDMTLLRAGVIDVALSWHALDPFLYDATPRVAPAVLAPAAGGGPAYPRGFPRGWVATPDGTIIGLQNDGIMPVRPLVQIHAGVSGCATPSLTDINSGATITFDITLAPGFWLLVDMDRATVVLTPDVEHLELGASRANAVRRPGSSWLEIPPGGTAWQCLCTTGAATARVISRDAWL